MEKKFTVEQFKNYLLLQDSMGDAVYNLSEENIESAQVDRGDNNYLDFGPDNEDDWLDCIAEFESAEG